MFLTIQRILLLGGIYSEPLTEEDIYKRTILVVRRKLANMKHTKKERLIELARVTARRYVGEYYFNKIIKLL